MISRVNGIDLVEQDRARLRQLVAGYCGLDGSAYADSTLDRAIAHRLAARRVADLGAYWPLLQTKREREREMSSLLQLLLDPEPVFFRDMQLYRDLQELVLPELIATGRTCLRFWSVGCGSGAGTYSLAIAIMEYEARNGPINTEIVATDLDETALAAARHGRYGAGALHRMPDNLRQTYFSSEGETHRIASPVAQRVVFMRHNLAEEEIPPELTGMDVIDSRRLTSHLDSQAWNRLITHLAGGLHPGGYLFAATNSTAREDPSGFELVSAGHTSLYRIHQPLHSAAPSRTPEGSNPGWGSVMDPVPVLGFQRALETFQRGDYESAWAELGRLPADDPFWPEVYCLRAAVLVQQQRWEEAEAICQQLLAHDPWQPDAHFLMGVLSQQQGQPEAAIESWKLVALVQPEHWDTHFRLAETYREIEAWELAHREYRYTLNILNSQSAQMHGLSLAGLTVDTVRQVCEKNLRRLQWRVGMSTSPEELGN